MAINNSTTFLHSFFWSATTYSADAADRKTEPFVIAECIRSKKIEEIYSDGKRLYRILPEGQKIIKRGNN